MNNALQVERANGVLERYVEAPEVAGRIFRLSDVDDLTTYSLGPLMPSDNGTVLVCSVDTFVSNRSTVTVICKYNLTHCLIIICLHRGKSNFKHV